MDTYEKNIEIPGHSWTYDYKPTFEVDIQPADTAFLYRVSVNVRHEDAYPFNNMWINLTTKLEGSKDSVSSRVNLPLADAMGKWSGSGVDDIFEHRVQILDNAVFDKPGKYKFTFEQKMRQNPLPHVMNVGLRIEKVSAR